MIKLCKNCGTKEISDKATFCSDKCRKAFGRKSDTTDIKSDKTPTRTTSDKHIEGTCYGCGERQPNPLTDICYKCIAKRLTRESLGLEITERQAWLNECQA